MVVKKKPTIQSTVSKKESIVQKKKSIIQKKKSKALMIICLFIGIGIGLFTEFNLKDFIENISEYKLVFVKKDDSQDVVYNKETEIEDIKDENLEAQIPKSEEVEVEKINNESAKQEKKEISTEDKIKKAKQSIVEQCGSDFSDLVYAAEGPHPTKGGNYYTFNIGEDVTGDMQFYVDKNTYKVYEYSVDGYFGKYRNYDSSVFTYDMAVRRLENELGWDERRKYTLVEEDSDGYKIRTSFVKEPGSGEGLYYVTHDFLDICFE